jgi:hypothetical protein
MLAYNYPLLNLFWTMFLFFLGILWVFLIVVLLWDLFRSSDVGGIGKAVWTIVLLLLPFIGPIIYLVMRGGSLRERAEARQWQKDEEAAQRNRASGETS